uniref:LRR-RLK n=1 Tax=Vernicia fordii TaxID=73154 RepID=A0A127AXL2_VERFO|nr:LRR-RLK [Vernicia fordii]
MIIVQAVHEGKIIFKRRRSCTSINEISSIQAVLPDFKLNPEPKCYLDDNHTSSREAEAPDFAETNSCAGQSSENVSINDNIASLKDGNGYKQKISLKSISIIRRELPESSLGWPLRRRIFPKGQDAFRRSKARSMSLIEWVTSLPTRSSEMIMNNPTDSNSDEANIFLDGKTDDFISNNEGTSVQVIHSSENDQSIDRSSKRKDEESGYMQETLSGSFSALTEESTQLTLGWPLLSIKTSAILDSLEESESSCGMSLPNQSAQATPKSQIDLPLAAPRELPMIKSSGCKQFSYKELEKQLINSLQKT